jgi:hypothetical protein
MRPREQVLIRHLVVYSLVLSLAMRVLGETSGAPAARASGTIHLPFHIGGASGQRDERDTDLYSTIAYDPSGARYLVVWLSARRASSSSDGLDVYAVFIDRAGRPVGSEFRISDHNSAARNGLPAVVAGNSGFVVLWTAKEGRCRIYAQRVTDTRDRADRLLASEEGHVHSPSLAYNRQRRRYALAYVAGDDYLPPTLAGAATADCGNDSASSSRIQATEFYFDREMPVSAVPRVVSGGSGGAFRPHLAHNNTLNRYLVAWEDRRSANGEEYRFDVYAQRLNADLALSGNNLGLDSGSDYANEDTSATWTPRPAVAAGGERFLATWFSRSSEGGAAIWSVKASLIPRVGAPGTAFTVAQMSFAQSHAGQAPTGFLSATYAATAREYLVGMTSHLESIWGYLSSARIQRIGSDGQLLAMDGSPRTSPGVGYAIDYQNDDQIAIGLAVNPMGQGRTADYVAVYAKHQTGQTAQDFDIWGVRVEVPAPHLQHLYLPLVTK